VLARQPADESVVKTGDKTAGKVELASIRPYLAKLSKGALAV
jgi:hypothetical protein